jgi:hypothetical protein
VQIAKEKYNSWRMLKYVFLVGGFAGAYAEPLTLCGFVCFWPFVFAVDKQFDCLSNIDDAQFHYGEFIKKQQKIEREIEMRKKPFKIHKPQLNSPRIKISEANSPNNDPSPFCSTYSLNHH